MRRAGKFLCLLLIFAFVTGAGAFDGPLTGQASAAGGFETVPGSPLADGVRAGTLRGFLPGTKAGTVRGNFTTEVSVCRAGGTAPVGDGEAVRTGDVVKNAEGETLNIAVIGDVTGDGMVSAADCAALKLVITEAGAGLSPACLSAADVDGGGIAAAEDYAALKKEMRGAGDIYSSIRCKAYELVTALPKYGCAEDAESAVFPAGTANNGMYYMHKDYPAGLGGMYCLTESAGDPEGFWVNPLLNIPALVPYSLVRSINKYASADDAAKQVNASGVADKAGSYFIYKGHPNGVGGMYNITADDTGNTAGFWINPSENAERLNYKTMKALWLSQFDMGGVYVKSGVQMEETGCRGMIKKTLEKVRDCGYNTIMVQVHPNGDSFFQSAYFPWSKYVTGAYGTAGIYSPFDIVIDEAQKLALSVHAWVNPMRLMSVSEIDSIGTDNTIGQWHADPEKEGKYIVPVGSFYYLNPCYAPVRELIVNGVTEVCNKAIDGVHFDDYFYPEGWDDSFDAEEFENSNNASLTLWRKALVNNFVSRTYSAVKEADPELQFGISPAGTVGVNDTAFADVEKWCKEPGYVDYIAPQLYWGFEGANRFDEKLAVWEDLVRGHGARLIPAMTLEYAYDESPQEWADNKDVIKREMERAGTCTNFGGVMVFSLKDFYNPVSGTYMANLTAERANYEPVLKAMYGGN